MPPATPTIVYATASGATTRDHDEFGGNPFASALIELSQQRGLALARLLAALRRSTCERSDGDQTPNWSGPPADPAWVFDPPGTARRERRSALVLVVSDYPGAPLAGAAHDERRIAAMLAGHGFSVRQGVASDRPGLLHALRSFALASQGADAALIYSTGHGVERGGHAHLLAGDYPFDSGYGAAMLRRHAVPVARIAAAARSSRLNLMFFAGCRTSVDCLKR